LNSENYQEAIEILKGRFGNEQILISAHMESLLRISKIASRDNIKELRMLYNHVESCVRNLKSLKLDTSGYGSLLIPILKDRLPDEITMIISRKFGEEIWTDT
jgi:signal-transduction protein with cAMP-binding, CBS, and nucleotidyltransferase domain